MFFLLDFYDENRIFKYRNFVFLLHSDKILTKIKILTNKSIPFYIQIAQRIPKNFPKYFPKNLPKNPLKDFKNVQFPASPLEAKKPIRACFPNL